MRSGAVIGCAAMMDGIVARLEKQLGEPVNAILTGGLSTLIAPYCEHAFHLEPDLLITGLRILYEKNAPSLRR
jgi:type III pantothenate kinase